MPAETLPHEGSAILLSLDGSNHSEQATSFAIEQAKVFGGHLIVLRVVPPVLHAATVKGHLPAELAAEPSLPQQLLDAEVAEAEDYVKHKAVEISAQGVPAEGICLLGQPAETIIDHASEVRARTIVMATHGRAGIGRWLLGSIEERVVRSSPIPVLLIRAGPAS